MALVAGGGRIVIPKPVSNIRSFGCVAVDSKDFYEVTSIVIPSGKKLQLTKLSVSADDGVMVKVVFGEDDITMVYYISGTSVFTDWFPYNWNPIEGDGTTKLKVVAKALYTAANVCADICGELEKS